MSERRDTTPDLLLVPDAQAVRMLGKAYDALHPPRHMPAVAALYIHGGHARTSSVNETMGYQFNRNNVWHLLFRSEAIVQAIPPKLEPKVQEAKFVGTAESLRYPELCVLMMNWMNRDIDRNSRIFFGKRSISKDVSLMLATYQKASDDRSIDNSERTRALLDLYVTTNQDRVRSEPKGIRAERVKSLRKFDLIQPYDREAPEVRLTQMGISFVEDVIIPHATLLADPAHFMESDEPRVIAARNALLMEPTTAEIERHNLGNRIKNTERVLSKE